MPVYTTVTANGKKRRAASTSRASRVSNTVAVADAVAREIAQLRQKLPPGVKLEPFYDQSQLVRDSISSVRDAIFIGLILACIILFLFLRDWTSSLDRGTGHSGHRCRHGPRALGHRPELQPDDARRPRRGHRPGHRRRYRRG